MDLAIRYGDSNGSRFTLINTTAPGISLSARALARSHAAKWSSKKARSSKAPKQDVFTVQLPARTQKAKRKPAERKHAGTGTGVETSMTQALKEESEEPPSQPQTMLDTSSVDPFDTSAVPIDGKMSLCLKYWVKTITPSLWHGKGHASRVGHEFFRYAVEDPACLNSVMYRVMFDFEDWRRNPSSPSSEEEFAVNPLGVGGGGQVGSLAGLRAGAAQMLAQSIGEECGRVNPAMLLTTGHLLTGELFLGNLDGMTTHFTGLKVLIEAGGGLNQYHPILCAAIMVLSCIAAVKLGVTPPEPPAIPEDLVLSEHTRRTIQTGGPDPTMNKMATSFLSPDKLIRLGHDLLSLILQRRSATLFQVYCNDGYLDLPDDDFKYFCLQVRSTEYALVRMATSAALSPVQEVVRLALLSFSFASTAPPNRATSAYSCCFAGELAAALARTVRAGLWGSRDDALLLWALFVAVHASSGRKERTWLVVQLARCVYRMAYTDMSELQETLQCHFYLECVNGRTLKDVWDEYEILLQSGVV